MDRRSAFDQAMENLARRVAGHTGRRGFIGNLGAKIAGVALLPLLPVDRRGRLGGSAYAAGLPPRDAWKPQTTNTKSCDYWRHCSIDGNICDCCGGTLTNCPPGSKLSPSSWVASCYNPEDKQTYLIAYRDCCGKDNCGMCNCFNTQGELPVYRPEFANDIVWCFGAEDDSMTYHCTISPIVGKAS